MHNIAGRGQWLRILIFSIVAVAMVGCGGGSEPPPPPQAATPIQVALDWTHTSEYAGFYLAQDGGLYAAQNLNVAVLPDQTSSSIIKVTSGDAQFGLASADEVILARASGAPIVAIYTIYQRDALAFISLENQHILRPEDLIGKRILINPSGNGSLIFKAMLASQSIDEAKVTIVPRTDYTNTPLISGDVEVMDAFINNQPIQLHQQGYEVNALLPSDYGIDVYPNVVFTTEEFIRSKPEVVQAFVTATVRGMQLVIDDPTAALQHVLSRDPALNPTTEGESLQRALPLMNPAGSRPGMMSDSHWAATHQIMQEQGILKQPIAITQAYTLTFLKQAYQP